MTADVSLLRRGTIAIGVYAQECSFFFHLPKSSSYGLPEESIISMTALTAAHKSAIYGVRGALGNQDMQAINERLRRVLSLDLSRPIAAASKDLLGRAGLLAHRSCPGCGIEM